MHSTPSPIGTKTWVPRGGGGLSLNGTSASLASAALTGVQGALSQGLEPTNKREDLAHARHHTRSSTTTSL
eukprot:766229-Lingulodinium_polyedra.AAC.1